MEAITLYSTGCPQCEVVKEKLEAKNIVFNVISNKEEIMKKGFTKVPVLQIGASYYESFIEICAAIRERI